MKLQALDSDAGRGSNTSMRSGMQRHDHADDSCMSAAQPLAQVLLDHQGARVDLCRAHGVDRLEVFGSAADGRFDPARSDIDLIVSFAADAPGSRAERYFALADVLERLLGRPVDLLTDQPIRKPYLRRAVDATRRELYVRTPAEASG